MRRLWTDGWRTSQGQVDLSKLDYFTELVFGASIIWLLSYTLVGVIAEASGTVMAGVNPLS